MMNSRQKYTYVMQKSGAWPDEDAFQPSTHAGNLRAQRYQTFTTDGLYPEIKEHLEGST